MFRVPSPLYLSFTHILFFFYSNLIFCAIIWTLNPVFLLKYRTLALSVPFCLPVTSRLTFHFTFPTPSSFSFSHPSHAFLAIFLFPLLFCSLCLSLPFSLSLLPLSSVPRGYYLSRRQICPIINLISSFSLPLPLSRSHLLCRAHTQQPEHKHICTSTKRKHLRAFSFPLSTASQHIHVHIPPFPSSFCHTLKSQLYTLSPFASSLLLSPLPHHHHTDLKLTTTKRRQNEERRR